MTRRRESLRGLRSPLATVLIGAAWMATQAGCGGKGLHAARIEVAPERPTIEDELRAVFAPGRAILDGFDIATEAAVPEGSPLRTIQAGDAVLLGLMIQRPSGGEDARLVRYLLVEAAPGLMPLLMAEVTLYPSRTRGRAVEQKVDTMVFPTVLRLFDERCELIMESPARVLGVALASGPFDAVEARVRAAALGAINAQGEPDESAVNFTEPERMRQQLGWVSLVAFSGAVGKNKPLTDLVKQVVARPSLLELVFKPELSLKYGPAGVSEGPDRVLGEVVLRTRTIQLDAVLSGRLSVRSDLIAGPIHQPLGLCGGLVALDGARADESGVRLHVRLLAAKRGKHADIDGKAHIDVQKATEIGRISE